MAELVVSGHSWLGRVDDLSLCGDQAKAYSTSNGEVPPEGALP